MQRERNVAFCIEKKKIQHPVVLSIPTYSLLKNKYHLTMRIVINKIASIELTYPDKYTRVHTRVKYSPTTALI